MTIAFFGCIFCVMSAGLAAAALSVVAFFVGRRSVGGDAARFYSRASPFPAAPSVAGLFP